ncbi:MAG: VCBS repeat-containing protein, partial [Acidobacteria bacterium]|nr:VCBS repeat-containing protein [Acidobacteriota bacterium]
ILNSFDSSLTAVSWGGSTDKPAPGDYNGDGRLDLAIWHPSDGNWWVYYSPTSYTVQQWGTTGDQPVPGDYDQDGKTDLSVWRPSNGTWYILLSSNSTTKTVAWGANGDVPVSSSYLP